MPRTSSRSPRPGSLGSSNRPGKAVDPTPLLLASGLTVQDVRALLEPFGFADLKRADANIQAMGGEPRSRLLLARLLVQLLTAVSETANPDLALTAWERFLSGLNRNQLFEYLASAPRILHLLCGIFGNSAWMAQTLVRDPMLVYWLAEEQALSRRPSRRDLEQALQALLANVTSMELKLEALRRFRRREMLRIGVRDLLKLTPVWDTTKALSELAGVLIHAAYEIVEANLRQDHGVPCHRNRTGQLTETGFAVVAMGKLGGGELNFSSDVDLIYVYESEDGETRPEGGGRGRGAKVRPGTSSPSIPNEEFFEYLARDLTRALTEGTQEGYVFRVDLRLRAEGAVGRLAQSLAGYQQYYRTRGQVWERLALLKAWPIAGRLDVGRKFLQMTRGFVFGTGQPGIESANRAVVLEQVRTIKEMIGAKMMTRGQEFRNVKLGTGGIREIEFIVQAVQVLCGGTIPEIRDRGTMGALARFAHHGLLSASEHAALAQAYLFLRDVEHKLQMVDDLQTHALPETSDEVTRCAIRLGYPAGDRDKATRRFLDDYRRHTDGVHAIFKKLFYAPERSPLLQAALRKEKAKRGGGVSRSSRRGRRRSPP